MRTSRLSGGVGSPLRLDHDIGEQRVDGCPCGRDGGSEVVAQTFFQGPEQRRADRGIMLLDCPVASVPDGHDANGGDERFRLAEGSDHGRHHRDQVAALLAHVAPKPGSQRRIEFEQPRVE